MDNGQDDVRTICGPGTCAGVLGNGGASRPGEPENVTTAGGWQWMEEGMRLEKRLETRLDRRARPTRELRLDGRWQIRKGGR